MPIYGTLTLPSCPYPGDTGYASINENTGVGAATSGVAGERIAIFQAQDGTVPYVRAEISFVSTTTGLPATPGAFTLQFQDADTDADQYYQSINFGGGTPGQVTLTQLNAKFTANVELLIKGKFLRPLMVTQPANTVKCLVTLSR